MRLDRVDPEVEQEASDQQHDDAESDAENARKHLAAAKLAGSGQHNIFFAVEACLGVEL